MFKTLFFIYIANIIDIWFCIARAALAKQTYKQKQTLHSIASMTWHFLTIIYELKRHKMKNCYLISISKTILVCMLTISSNILFSFTVPVVYSDEYSYVLWCFRWKRFLCACLSAYKFIGLYDPASVPFSVH